jgi:hypothetical protein
MALSGGMSTRPQNSQMTSYLSEITAEFGRFRKMIAEVFFLIKKFMSRGQSP